MAVLIEPMYLTEDGLEFITNPEDKVFIEQQRALDKFYYGFHIQILDGAIVYALYQNHDPTHYENMRRHYHKSLYDPHFKKVHPVLIAKSKILKECDLKTLYEELIAGQFDIGIAYVGSYHVITRIKHYEHEDNDELRLHYTKPRSFEGNIAWRSIKWDLFENIVEKIKN